MSNTKRFTFFNGDGTDYDLSGVTLSIGIKRPRFTNDILTLTSGQGLTISGNDVDLELTSLQSAEFDERVYYFELRRVISGKQKVWLNGDHIWHKGTFDAFNDNGTNITIDDNGEDVLITINESGSSGGVQSITGDYVDNTDPANPVVVNSELEPVIQAGHSRVVGEIVSKNLQKYNSATDNIEDIWGIISSVPDANTFIIQKIISGRFIYLPDIISEQRYYIQGDGTYSTTVTDLPLGFGDGPTLLRFSRVSYIGMVNPMTTISDLITADIGGVPVRLPIGTEGQVLKVVQNDELEATWQNESVTLTNTVTLTNKRITQRVQSVASSGTVTANADTNDMVIVTAQAEALTLANPSGTPTEGQGLIYRIKDNGTARTIGYGANFRAMGITLPTTTVISKTLYLACVWNVADSRWDVIGERQEA
jgi:hypothetical protein